MSMKMRWYALQEQKKNNKGSSIVMVLVIMALLMILVTIVLSLALRNYRMKTTNRESIYNFYSAETALDEIRAGLTKEVSTAAADAYNTTMAEFATMDESARRQKFQTEYIHNLKDALAGGTNGGTGSVMYSIEYIAAMIQETGYIEEAGVGAKLLTAEGENVINETKNGLILKNIIVAYYGENDFYSEIKTDIVLEFPDINFSQMATMPNLLAYALVAQDSIQVTDAAVCTIKGNAYLGTGESIVENAHLIASSKTTAVDNQLLISGGTIKGTTNANIQVADMELWVQDIVVDSSVAGVDRSSVYLQDDLILSNSLYHAGGTQTESKVFISGAYYGFGNVETAVRAGAYAGDAHKVQEIQNHPANYNSSMIINGVNSTLDISGLSVFKLAGNAYVNGTEHADAVDEMIANANRSNADAVDTKVAEGVNTEDVRMGESLAIRSDQIAWMVPADCIAPETENGGVNPMPITQYSELIEELENLYGDGTSNFRAVDKLVSLDTKSGKLGGATLGELGVTGWQIEAQQVVGTAKSMVYVFVKFDSTESANAFFRRYYSNAENLTKLGEYLDLYATGGIRLPQEVLDTAGDTNFFFQGNLLASEAAKLYVPDTPSGVSASTGAQLSERMLEEGIAYQDNFAALNTKLLKDYSQLLDDERGKTVYENLVNSMISGASTEYSISEGSSKVFVKSTGQAAIIANGDFVLNDTNLAVVKTTEDVEGGCHSDAECYVIIASGDITVEKDFTGLIFAGGKITVAGKNVTLTADARNAAQALMAENAAGIHAYDYLKNGETYTISGNLEGAQPALYSEDSLNMTDYVLYANWSKQ